MKPKYILFAALIFLSGCKELIDELHKKLGTYIDPEVSAKADAGDALSQYELGNIYIKKASGNNNSIDREPLISKGLELLEKSAASGNINAMYRLGVLYGIGERGIGTHLGGELCVNKLIWCSETDRENLASTISYEQRGLKYMIYAADNGHVEAINHLLYASNEPAERKHYWLTLAAKKGDHNAMTMLAIEAKLTAKNPSNYKSGHEAGREWAIENGITDEMQCDGDSESFNEGCVVQAEANQLENAMDLEQNQYEQSLGRQN